MPLTRRAMLGLLSSSTFFLTAGGRLAAAPAADAPRLTFPQGVASGDPQPDAVMLWTRALPAKSSDTSVPLVLQVSRSSDFSAVLLQVQLATARDSDYTLRAYIDGLDPDSTYYYRFLGGDDSRSRIGRTRTAPLPGAVRDVRLAFVSCQNFEDGYYASWARMLAEDAAAAEEDQIQFVLHLGDFIYERCWNSRSGGGALARRVPPFPDGVITDSNRHAVSLDDYRHLYRTYLGDPHLQAARARWPFICTWDDHEFANDNYQSYSTYQQAAPELQATRKQHANRAWFEYIPAVLDELEGQPAHGFRPGALDGIEAHDNATARDSLRIYRQLRWGKNLDLLLTDSRSYRSPPCLPAELAGELGLPLNTVELVTIADAGRAYANGSPPGTLPYGDGSTPNPAREREPGSMLGTTQREWLLDSLAASTARWKVWGNALPLLPLRLDLSSLPFTDYQDSIFNIDSWSGYPHELAYLMQELARREVSGLVSLSGDHHMHGAGTICHSTTATDAMPVMADFNVAGISSSPLFEELAFVARRDHPAFQPIVYDEQADQVVPVWNMTMLDGVFASLCYSKTGLTSLARWLGPNHANPGLSYVDTTANGYGLARFTAAGAEVELVTMSDCRSPFSDPPAIAHSARFELAAWQPGQAPVIDGPRFRLGAPFPFPPPTV